MRAIHWNALSEYCQMSTHVQGFLSFSFFFLHHFVMAKLATSSVRANTKRDVLTGDGARTAGSGSSS